MRKNILINAVLILLMVLISGQALAETSISLKEAEEVLLELLQGREMAGKDLEKIVEQTTGDLPVEIVGYTDMILDYSADDNSNYYFVQPGDSLYKVARKYETDVNSIKLRNNLKSDYLYVGQKLFIPLPDKDSNFIYHVKPGDTLYLLAEKYETTVSRIKKINGYTADYLYVGQKIRIPMAGPQTEVTYYVQSGDSLYKIASKFQASIDQIKVHNNLRSNYLYVGQKLSIPLASSTKRTNGRISVNEEEMILLARAVYSEARGESFKGQVAIAAVIINRILHPLFPDTVRGVIFQPWQFTAVHDGQFWLEPNHNAYRAVEEALNGWDPTNGAIYYYNPRTATSRWVFYRTVIIKIGEHYFAV